jgi:hypothetical protein
MELSHPWSSRSDQHRSSSAPGDSDMPLNALPAIMSAFDAKTEVPEKITENVFNHSLGAPVPIRSDLPSCKPLTCPPASALFSSDSSYAHARFEPDQLGMAIVTTGLSYRERMLWTGNRTRHAVSVTSQKAYYGKSTRTRPPQQSTSIGTKAWTPCRNSIAFGRFARYTTAWASEFPADVCRQILEASKNSAYACISTFSGHQYLDRLYSIAPPPKLVTAPG